MVTRVSARYYAVKKPQELYDAQPAKIMKYFIFCFKKNQPQDFIRRTFDGAIEAGPKSKFETSVARFKCNRHIAASSNSNTALEQWLWAIWDLVLET